MFFFFNDTATTEIYTLSLHDALPICLEKDPEDRPASARELIAVLDGAVPDAGADRTGERRADDSGLFTLAVLPLDRKSTRLNSSHANISYAVFCLKKKNKIIQAPVHI